MKEKDYIIQAKIHNPNFNLQELVNIADELLQAGYLSKDVKTKKELTKKLNLPEVFKTDILEDNDFLVKLKTDYNMEANFFKNEMNKFLSYRTEKGHNQRKERWEKEKVFEIKRRFTTWISNNKSKPGGTKNFTKEISHYE